MTQLKTIQYVRKSSTTFLTLILFVFKCKKNILKA